MKIILQLVVLLLLATPLTATEVKTDGDQLIVELEGLVKTYPVQPTIRQRIEVFLEKHHCRMSGFYATLIDRVCEDDADKKRWAAKLIIESRGATTAVSSEGAVGPWQMHPRWFRVFKVSRKKAKEPYTNLTICRRIYDEHLRDHHENVRKAEIAYSGGSRWYPGLINKLMREV